MKIRQAKRILKQAGNRLVNPKLKRYRWLTFHKAWRTNKRREHKQISKFIAELTWRPA